MHANSKRLDIILDTQKFMSSFVNLKLSKSKRSEVLQN